jgi:hypothetical protein
MVFPLCSEPDRPDGRAGFARSNSPENGMALVPWTGRLFSAVLSNGMADGKRLGAVAAP